MRKLLAILVVLSGLAASAYVTYVFVVGGIHNLNTGFAAHPIQVGTIVWGVAELLLVWDGATALILMIAVMIAFFLWDSGDRYPSRRLPFRRGGVPVRSSGRWPGGF